MIDLHKVDRVLKITTTLLMALLFLMAFVFWEFLRNAEPYQRSNAARPLFTVGNPELSLGLASGQQTVRLGPLFWGLVSGAPAFSSVAEAKAWLAQNPSLNWRVYELAGDYGLDSDQGEILRTLVIYAEVL
jgi:hypothetical protein